MKRLNRILAPTLVLIWVFTFMSCTFESEIEKPENPWNGNTAEISFLADIPVSTAVTTRSAVGTIPENTINDIYILVFEKSGAKELVYKGKGKNLTIVSSSTNSNKVTFKATLPVGTEYTFMVLANAENQLTDITSNTSPAKTKTDVLNLVQSLTAGDKWNSTSPKIPMWGEKDLILTATSSPTFMLTRMLAKVNLEFNPKNIATKNDFKLTSIRYFNFNTSGTLVSNDGNYSVDGNGMITVTAPTLPTTPGTQIGGALVYDGADITNNSECKNKIYIFEAAHNNATYTTPANNTDWINNPCIVIGGEYKNGTETFYRIDFIKKDTTNPDNVKDIWLSILRNFSYNITITEVSGEGYNTPDVALKSAPINIEANVLNWHERDMGDIVFDGVFYLSVSKDEFVFQRNGVDVKQADNTVFIKTDYVYNNNKLDAKSGWKVERYEHINGTEMTPAEQWLTLVPNNGAPDVRAEAYFTFVTNTGSTHREANVWIAAGRLRYKIHVIQRVLSLDILNSSNAPITEMLFVIPRTGDRTHTPAPFNVVWTPVNESVAITSESKQVWNPFEPGWLTPDPDATQHWVIPAGSGTQTYAVKPPTVSDAELGLDPFYEKESTYKFKVDNGTDTEEKSINLRQIYYNIIADTYAYHLDGKTYTMSIRSNTEWKITKIEEWLFNVDPQTLSPGERPTNPILLQLKPYDNLRVGTTGGPNLAGNGIAFTVVNQNATQHRNKWGTVYVTVESPDNKVPAQRIALRFPRSGVTILGLGFARDLRGFNTAIPSTYHLQSLNRMLTSQINFGNMDESVVKVEDLNIIGYNCEGLSKTFNTTGDWMRGDLRLWLNQHKPDIITMTYSMRLIKEEAELIKEFLKNGGVVIMHYGGEVQIASDVKIIMDVIFEKNFATSDILREVTSIVYKFQDGSAFASDPILNGPFMDVRGKPWGVHLSHTQIKASAIQDDVHILSMVDSQISLIPSIRDWGYANIFRHKKYNFLWVGNAMGTATSYVNENDTFPLYDPNRIDNKFRPAVRTGFGEYAPRFDVYNTYFFANAIAWGISVANHQPPPGGY